MKKFLLFNLIVAASSSMYAQCNPDFSTYTVDTEAGKTRFWYGCPWIPTDGCKGKQADLELETPPWIIGGGGQSRSFFTTNGNKSFVSAIDKNIIGEYWIDFREGGTGPTIITDDAGPRNPIPVPANLTLNQPRGEGYSKATSLISMEDGFEVKGVDGNYTAVIVNGLLGGEDWRRSYYNVYTAQYINHPTNGPVTLGFLDAENKAGCNGATIIPSSVHPYKSSYTDQPYVCPDIGDFWPTMAGFVCASFVVNDPSTNYGQKYFNEDMGPIAWPSNGYNAPDNVNRRGHGVGLPSSIIWDGYVYVFYHDDGPFDLNNEPPIPREHGRSEGVKVVRAPISDCLNPYAYHAYYKDPGGGEHWNPSLPAGFDRDNMDVFWSAKGPKCTDLMNDVTDLYDHKRFSVAHAAGSNPACFIGVESYVVRSTGMWEIRLRYSPDLVNWSAGYVISSSPYTSLLINYPIFCDVEGWSNTEVDINNFFLLGKGAEMTNEFNKIHVYNPGARKAVSVKKVAEPAARVEPAKAIELPAGILPTPNHGIFRVNYSITTNTKVQINVLDITGKKVHSVNPATKGPGNYVEHIDINAFGKGIYIVELITGGTRQIFKTVKQ